MIGGASPTKTLRLCVLRENIIRGQWEELVDGGLELHCIPGDHDSSVREPLVQGLAEKLRGYLGS